MVEANDRYDGYRYKGKVSIAHEPPTIDKEVLWDKYISRRRPVVIDGLLQDAEFKAQRWTSLEYLRSKAGHVTVKIEPIHPELGHFGTAMTRRNVTLGEYLDMLKDPDLSGRVYLTTQYEDSDEEEEDGEEEKPVQKKRKFEEINEENDEEESDSDSGSLAAASDISLTVDKDDIDPVLPSPTHALIDEFPPKPSIMGGLVLQQSNLWLGSSPAVPKKTQKQKKAVTNGDAKPQVQGKSSGLHHDFHDNLYVLLSGTKRFLLFPPSAHKFLHTRGTVHEVYENGLIVYKDEKEDDDSDLEDEALGTKSALDILQKRLLAQRSSNPSIRSDGLPRVQAALWRVRARVRRLRELEDAAAQSAGEASRNRSERKGKNKMSHDMELAIAAYELAKHTYRKEVLREQYKADGMLYFSDSSDDDDEDDEDDSDDLSDDSADGLLSSDDGDDSDEEESDGAEDKPSDADLPLGSIDSDLLDYGDSDLESTPKKQNGRRKKGTSKKKKKQPGNSSKVLVEEASDDGEDDEDHSDGSGVEEDELAALLEDATMPLEQTAVYSNGNGTSKQGESKSDDEEDDGEGDDTDAAVEEDELAALLEDATKPLEEEGHQDDESAGAEDEDMTSDGFLTTAQLKDLQKRFGKTKGSKNHADAADAIVAEDDDGEDDDDDNDDNDDDERAQGGYYEGPVREAHDVRKIVSEAYGEDLLNDVPDEHVIELIYFTPLDWIKTGKSPYLKKSIASNLVKVWAALSEHDQEGSASEEEEGEDEGMEEEEGWRLFDEIERQKQEEEDALLENEDSDDEEEEEDEDSEDALQDSLESEELGEFVLEQDEDSDDSEARQDMEADDTDSDEEGPTFDDNASMGSQDFGDVEDGEAALAALLAEAEAESKDAAGPGEKPEPRSFSLIKPDDLHRHFGIGASKLVEKERKEQAKKLKKFESVPLLPLKGCPQPIEVELKAGQMLYLPASWFHEVTSMSGPAVGSAGADSEFHMALNYWFHPPTQLEPDEDDEAMAKTAAASSATQSYAWEIQTGTVDHPYEDQEVWGEISRAVQAQIDSAMLIARNYSEKVLSQAASTEHGVNGDKVKERSRSKKKRKKAAREKTAMSNGNGRSSKKQKI